MKGNVADGRVSKKDEDGVHVRPTKEVYHKNVGVKRLHRNRDIFVSKEVYIPTKAV